MPASGAATTGAPKVVQLKITKDGAEFTKAQYDAIEDVDIGLELYTPGSFVLRLHDDDLALETTFDIGQVLEFSFPNNTGTLVSVLKAEITAIEPEFAEDMTVTLIIRGYHKGHRLGRGTQLATFIDKTDSDIVKALAASVSLTPEVTATGPINPYTLQANISNLALIQQLAERNGFELNFEGDKLLWKAPAAGTPVTLAWGSTLRKFNPRISASRQVSKVEVYGWDQKTKVSLSATATTSTSHASIGYDSGKSGVVVSDSKFGAQSLVEARRDVPTAAAATKLAEGLLNGINASFIEADGIAMGNPALKAGTSITVSNVGTRFNGTYRITSARHLYSNGVYDTYFTIEGLKPLSLGGGSGRAVTSPPAPPTSGWWGVYPAIVTAINTDTAKPFGAKVKFPWLGLIGTVPVESNVARFVALGAGATRGMEWLPEVNDEVLVAFENGDINRPFILGGMWNGTDAPPYAASAAVFGANVKIRTLKTRKGSEIKFTDEDSGGKIEIQDGGIKVKIIIDGIAKTIVIESDQDATLKSTAAKVIINGPTGVDIQSNANITMIGKGNVNVEATGILTLKGAMVNIN